MPPTSENGTFIMPMPAYVADRAGVGAGGRDVADGEVEAALALEDGRDAAAADSHLDDVLDVADVDAVARCGRAVDGEAELGLVGLLLDGGVGGAGYLSHE